MEDSLNEFYHYLLKFSAEWVELAKKSEPLFSGLKNFSEQLRLIEKCTWKPTLIQNFPDVQAKLVNKIIYEIEEDMSNLQDIRKNLDLLKKNLKAKVDAIDKNAYKLDISKHLSFGEIAPPIYVFVEKSNLIKRHYTSLYIKIVYALANLNYKDPNSIDLAEKAFMKSFEIDEEITGFLNLWETLTAISSA